MRTNSTPKTDSEPVIIVCAREVMQRCIEELLYQAIYEIIVKNNIDVLDTQWDIEDRIRQAEMLINLPELTGEDRDLLDAQTKVWLARRGIATGKGKKEL